MSTVLSSNDWKLVVFELLQCLQSAFCDDLNYGIQYQLRIASSVIVMMVRVDDGIELKTVFSLFLQDSTLLVEGVSGI